MREFDLIARIAARSGRDASAHPGAAARSSPSPARGSAPSGIILGIGDDAAVLEPTPGMRLVATTDTLVHGIHYPPATPPADIGWKALAVNLSDLAAMAATPRWALLSLTLPAVHEDWTERFLDGWCALADASGIALVGGDTTRGPEAIGVTVLGEVASGAALARSGAVAGDRVWVSGTLGDAAAALRWSPGPQPGLPPQALRQRLHRPSPRLALGRALRGIATACIDVSDGLLADLGHVCRASGVAAELQLSALPASDALSALLSAEQRWPLQLTGGDDYELCFTAPESRDAELAALSADLGLRLTAIGRIGVGSGVRVLRDDGRAYDVPRPGYEHFA